MVGAGPAGLAAAIEAAQRGAAVCVLEQSHRVGGAARGGGGGTFVAGSPLQQRRGVDDTPDAALADWLAWGGAEVDEEWARRYVEASRPEVHDWLERLGVRWERLVHHEGNRVPRWHAPRGAGREIVACLAAAARARPGISWRLRTSVTALAVSGGRVTGVWARGPDGADHEITAQATVLAAGGFCSDATMVGAHAPVPSGARVLLGGADGARGDGHRMLDAVAADMVGLDRVWMYAYATPDPFDPTGRRGLVVRGIEQDVWVARGGDRFHDESRRGGATGTPAVLAQPEATCWSVFDAPVAATLRIADAAHSPRPGDETAQRLLTGSPFIARGATLAEVADRAGIAAGALEATVAAHNRERASGAACDELGRPLRGLHPLDEPPFTAVQLFPLARKNLGGVRTDGHGRVLDRAGRRVPGLLAAGEVAGMAGGHVNGRAALEGTMLGPSCYSGRVGGRSATA